MSSKSVFGYMALLYVFLLSACNGDDAQQQIPAGSKLTTSSDNIRWEITPQYDAENKCIFDSNQYNDTHIRAFLTNNFDSPLGGVKLDFNLDLTGNSFSGYSVMNLYYDSNGNGVVDLEELVSGVGQPSFEAETDNHLGIVDVILRINLSCPYKGNLFIQSPGASVKVAIETISITDPISTDVDDDQPVDPNPANIR